MTLQITKEIVNSISSEIQSVKGFKCMYAIFSKRLSSTKDKYQIEKKSNGVNSKTNWIEFHESDPNDPEVKIARTIAFLFFKLAGIKIIIEQPGIIMSEGFFLDVGIRPFELFPALVKLIPPSQLEMSYHAAESSVTIFNKISRRFLNAVDGLSPVLQKYPITCFQELNSYRQVSVEAIKLSLPLDDELNDFNKVEILDFQDPDEAMAFACFVSNSLFFKPSKNQSYYVTKRKGNLIMYYILRSSSNYDDISANLSLLKTAINGQKGSASKEHLLIIPISFPCFDILELFRRYVSEKQTSSRPIPCILFCDTINENLDWLTKLFQPFSADFNFSIAQNYNEVYEKTHEIKWVI